MYELLLDIVLWAQTLFVGRPCFLAIKNRRDKGKKSMKKYFQFDELGTNYRVRLLVESLTFLSMAYILILNPLTLSLSSVKDFPDELRMDSGAVFVATALAAAIGTLIMAFLAKYPIALAPGVWLNAFFAYTVLLTLGMSWQQALTGVFFRELFS